MISFPKAELQAKIYELQSGAATQPVAHCTRSAYTDWISSGAQREMEMLRACQELLGCPAPNLQDADHEPVPNRDKYSQEPHTVGRHVEQCGATDIRDRFRNEPVTTHSKWHSLRVAQAALDRAFIVDQEKISAWAKTEWQPVMAFSVRQDFGAEVGTCYHKVRASETSQVERSRQKRFSKGRSGKQDWLAKLIQTRRTFTFLRRKKDLEGRPMPFRQRTRAVTARLRNYRVITHYPELPTESLT